MGVPKFYTYHIPKFYTPYTYFLHPLYLNLTPQNKKTKKNFAS